MNSIVCKDVFQQIEEFEQCYFSLLISGEPLPEIYQKTTENQWKIILSMKERLNVALSV